LNAGESREAEYRRFLEWLRTREYVDYPFVVSIETLTLCNARCEFCPYPGLERQGERMPDWLVEKIIAEMGDIPPGTWFEINPSGINEPFLDSRIFAILEMINRRLPHAGIRLISNGSTLSEANLSRLLRTKNITKLVVSVNEFTPERYWKSMSLHFDRTLTRLNSLHEMKRTGQFEFPVVLSRVGDGTEDDSRFVDWVNKRYPGFESDVITRSDFMGSVRLDRPANEVPDLGCSQWFKLRILANGKVAFCCLDAEGKLAYGDARTEHLLEIYNRAARRLLRVGGLSRRAVKACFRCNAIV